MNCGSRVDLIARPKAETAIGSPSDRRGSALSLAVGIGVVVVVLAVGWLIASRLSDRTESDRSGETAEGSVSGDPERNTNGTAAADEPPRAAEGTTTTTAELPSSSHTTAEQSSTSSMAPFANKDVVYGRYVAVLWSGFVSNTQSASADPVLPSELAGYQARFGPRVIAVDSNQFRSLRDGTVAVVYDGGFTSARDGKRWCRDSGFPGTQDCFGVVLSDDFTPDQRGEFIRSYEL